MRYVASAVVVAAVTAGAAFAAPSASTVTIKTSTALGAKLVVNSAGLTLYHYTDEKNGAIDCKGPCAAIWPPLLAGAAKPVAGPGLSAAKLGTVKRPDGKVQVTYNGLALYRYAADKKPGDVKGQGVEGSWYAVTSAGKITKTKATGADAEATSASSGTTSSGATSGSTSSGGTTGTPAAPTGCTPGAIVTDPNSPCYNY